MSETNTIEATSEAIIPAPVAEINVRDITTPTETTPITPATPVAPVAATTTAALIGADGKLGENWFLGLGDEFSAHAKDLSKHKDIRSIITELQYNRKNGVEYPSGNSTEATVSRWKSVAGVPETAEGYNLAAPEGSEADSELISIVSAAALKSHAPPQIVEAIAAAYNEVMVKRSEENRKEAEKQFAEAQDSLVKSWGSDFENNASTARYMTKKLAESAGITDTQQLDAMLALPDFSRLMVQIAKNNREDSITHPTGYGDLRSPADRIEAIRSGKDPVWGEKWKSGDVDAYNFVAKLRQEALE